MLCASNKIVMVTVVWHVVHELGSKSCSTEEITKSAAELKYMKQKEFQQLVNGLFPLCYAARTFASSFPLGFERHSAHSITDHPHNGHFVQATYFQEKCHVYNPVCFKWIMTMSCFVDRALYMKQFSHFSTISNHLLINEITFSKMVCEISSKKILMACSLHLISSQKCLLGTA